MKNLLLVSTLALLLIINFNQISAQPSFEVIAKTGDKVYNSGTDEFFAIRNPTISDNGYFGFWASIKKGNDLRAAWVAGLPNDWTLMAEGGVNAPEINEVFTGPQQTLDYLQLSDNHVAFYYAFDLGSTSINLGGQISNIQLLSATKTEPYNIAPGTSGGYFATSRANPVINNQGTLAFECGLRANYGDVTSDNNYAIWTGKNDNLNIIARKGTVLPGINATIGGGTRPLINNSDQVLFEATIAPAESYSQSAILYFNNTYHVIARGGGPAQGVNGTYRTIIKKSLNNKGNLAYIANLEVGSGAITSDNNQGLWFGDKDNVQLIMQKGGAIPGVSGSIQNSGFSSFYLDDYDHIGFMTTIAGKNTIFAGPVNNFKQVVQEGQSAPGTSSTIQSIDHFEFGNGITFVKATTAEGKSGLWVYKNGQGYKVTYQGENIETSVGSILATNFNIRSLRLLSQIGEFMFTVSNATDGYLIKGYIEPLFNSKNANLATLTTSQGTLSPAFAASTTNYTVSLPTGTTTVPTVSATAADAKATVAITQAANLTGSAAQRTATVVVTAEDGTTKTYTVVFSIESAIPDFTLNASNASLSIPQGAFGTADISFTPSGGFSGAVALSIDASTPLPVGVSASFDPASISSGSSTLRFDVDATAAPVGPVTIKVRGVSGSISQTVDINLTITEVTEPTFTLNANPQSLTIAQGGGGEIDVTITALAGFDQEVELTYNLTKAGVSASFNPVFISGEGESLLSIIAEEDADLGAAELTITATSGTIVRTVSISLQVEPPPVEIYPANQFSPNGDGIDDTWQITDIEKAPQLVISVFNRVGQVVFKTKAYQNDWDGTSNGRQLLPATYFYVIRNEKGENVETGSVNLIR